MNEEKQTSKSSLFAFEAVLILALGLFAFMAAPYLLAVILGLILAVLSKPTYQSFRHKLNPHLSALLTVTLILVTIVGPLTLLGTVAVKQGIAIGQKMATDERFSVTSTAQKLLNFGPIKTFVDDPTNFENQIRSALESVGRKLSEGILIQASNLPDIIIQLVLALLSCFFLLVDGPAFISWLGNKIPLEQDIQKAMVGSFQNTSVSVIRAIIAAATAQTFIIMSGFLILGVPAAALAAGATFILSWVPVIGCSPVWISASLYLYFNGSLGRSIFMILVGMIAAIADNIIRPLMLRGKADLHPLVSLIALIGGLHLFGLIGIFLGPIIAAVLILLLQIWPVVAARAGLELHKR
jgi:predicted PurR-regulated permease PerM